MVSTGLESGCSSDGSLFTFRGGFSRLLCLALLGVVASLLAFDAAQAITPEESQEEVDYNQLKSVLGSSLPLGSGIPIAQVEAKSSGSPGSPVYFPITDYSQFRSDNDPNSLPVTFIDGSGGAANGESVHATTSVGQFFYGNTFSFSPGANTVDIYETNHWLNNVLKLNGETPATHNFRVENYSWIGSFEDSALDAQVLGRFDYLIDNNNITAVVGGNSSGAPNALLTHSLNAIAVGVSSGSNPTDPTESFYFPGRNKPDLVSPNNGSSSATAHVASTATMLHESGAGTEATQSETMKAILLAGATKDEFPTWSHTPTQPLDSQFGAGELNVYNSYVIQSGGKHSGGPLPVSSAGWDYNIATHGSSLYYNFHVPVGSTASELSIVLAWNAQVTDSPGSGFNPDVSIDNLDLRLYDSSNSSLETLIESSVGTVDNLEHIYLTGLSEGLYTLEVANQTAGGNRDFGLAWRMETLFNVESADFDANGNIDGTDFLTWQRNLGAFVGAAHSDGDGDGDGDVDIIDFLIFDSDFGASAGAAAAPIFIPEPTTLALDAVALIMLYMYRGFLWLPRHAGI